MTNYQPTSGRTSCAQRKMTSSQEKQKLASTWPPSSQQRSTEGNCLHKTACMCVCLMLLGIGCMGHNHRHRNQNIYHGDAEKAHAPVIDRVIDRTSTETRAHPGEGVKQVRNREEKEEKRIDDSCFSCHGRPTGFYADIVEREGGPVVYCKDGQVLIQNNDEECQKSGGYGGESTDKPLGPRSCGYLSDAVVRKLAEKSSTVTLSETGVGNCVSTNDKAVEALRTGGNWHNKAEWVADNPKICFEASGPPERATGWPNMFQSWGNVNCVHWLASEMHATTLRRPLGSSTWLTMLPALGKVVCPSVSPVTGPDVDGARFDPVVANKERMAQYGAATPPAVRYLSFEPWDAGFNNRRASLELATYFACVLNRTLIVPDLSLGGEFGYHKPDYHNGNRDQNLQYKEAFDLEHLGKYFNVIQYNDFAKMGGIDTVSKQDGYPTERETTMDLSVLKRRRLEPVLWCDQTDQTDPLICEAMKKLSQRSGYLFNNYRSDGDEKFHKIYYSYDNSGPTRRDDMIRRPLPLDHPSTNIHLPRNTLRTYYDKIRPPVSGAPPHMQQCQRSMREGFRFIPKIYEHAKAIVEELGGRDRYSAVHIRRGDFVGHYGEAGSPHPLLLLQKMAPLFNKNETVIICTDNEEEVFGLLGNSTEWTWPFRVQRPSDLVSERQMQRTLRVSAWGLVFQQVLVDSRVLVANHFSTFSSYAVRLRYLRQAPGITTYSASQITTDEGGKVTEIKNPRPPWWSYENEKELLE